MKPRIYSSLLLFALMGTPTLAWAQDQTHTLTEGDLKDVGLTLKFKGDKLELTGNLPDGCTVTMTSESVEPEESDSESSEIDLDARSKRLQVTIKYSGTKSWEDCEKEDKDATKQKKQVELSDTVNGKSELLIVQLPDDNGTFEDTEIFSPRYLSLEKLYKSDADKDCTNCNADKVEEALSVGEWFEPIAKSLMEDTVGKSKQKIEDAETLSGLNKILKELDDLAQTANKFGDDNKEDMLGSVSELYDELLAKNEAIAKESAAECRKEGKKRSKACARPEDHADFIAAVYREKAEFPGLDRDEKREARELKRAYSRGSARVNFIAEVDPLHPVATEALNDKKHEVLKRQQDVQYVCTQAPMYCPRAQAELEAAQNNFNSLYQRYMNATFQEQAPAYHNGMFDVGRSSGFAVQGQQVANAPYPWMQNQSLYGPQTTAVPFQTGYPMLQQQPYAPFDPRFQAPFNQAQPMNQQMFMAPAGPAPYMM